MIILNAILILCCGVLSVPIIVLFAETAAACGRASFAKTSDHSQGRPAAGILMPAHNEADVIHATLAALEPHLIPEDRVLVIADNCTDRTAEIAKQFRVSVVERISETERGKGFALAHGLNQWGDDVPEVVVIMDADCWFADGALDRIVDSAAKKHRPIQAVYLMEHPKNPIPRDQISAFAFLVKNLVRPLGLHRLGQPCLLTGTGMAFPRELLSPEKLATGNIVEDMQLGLDLAFCGTAPILAPDAFVWGRLPQQSSAATSQRTRWEHGHLQTLLTQTPRLFFQGGRLGRPDLLALALEMCVPPLSLLVIGWLTASAFSLGFCLYTKLTIPLAMSGISGVLLTLSILSAWCFYGRSVLPGKILLSIPWYMVTKVPLYFRFVSRRQKVWIRTQREMESNG